MIVSVSVAVAAAAFVVLVAVAVRFLLHTERVLRQALVSAEAGIAELQRAGKEAALLARSSRRLVREVRGRVDDIGPMCRAIRRSGQAIGRAAETFGSVVGGAADADGGSRGPAADAASIAMLGMQLWRKIRALRLSWLGRD
ncbi:DUF948 domain-containing protein [Paenibacillus cymbidii]|uniref:DUF948 domain-containing protein n=1 Tax=Paenibacillus cymbidii TaxID=1639034 RepID=UPI0010817B20|nr:DUF948 domain-containing protein [Paenibacillus cymbidii]